MELDTSGHMGLCVSCGYLQSCGNEYNTTDQETAAGISRGEQEEAGGG
jgi:hypothetical protein